MNHNENEKYDKSALDLSQFPLGKKKELSPKQKKLSLENLKKSWQRIRKKNQIFIIIIAITVISTIIFLTSLLIERVKREGGPFQTTPPTEYPLGPEEKYTPPFP